MNQGPALPPVEPIDVPRFHANQFRVAASPTEVSILCDSQIVGRSAQGETQIGASPAVQLGMSPAAAKELSLILQDIIATYEKDFGEIRTPFIVEMERG